MPLKRKITSLLNKSGDLSLQLFLLITLGYVLIILSIFTYRYQKLKQIEQKNIEKEIKEISKEFSSSIGKYLFEKKKNLLKENMNEVLEKELITGVKITDPLRNRMKVRELLLNTY